MSTETTAAYDGTASTYEITRTARIWTAVEDEDMQGEPPCTSIAF